MQACLKSLPEVRAEAGASGERRARASERERREREEREGGERERGEREREVRETERGPREKRGRRERWWGGEGMRRSGLE